MRASERNITVACQAQHAISNASSMTPGELSQAAFEASTCQDVSPEISQELTSLAARAYANSRRAA